jgi:hypothetical protein
MSWKMEQLCSLLMFGYILDYKPELSITIFGLFIIYNKIDKVSILVLLHGFAYEYCFSLGPTVPFLIKLAS